MLGGLRASVASGDEFLCGPRLHRHGDAAGVDSNGAGAADQFGLMSRVTVASHRGGLRATGDGPWDRQPVRSAGRLANYLDLHAWHFAALALAGVTPRNYRRNPKGFQSKDL